MLEAMTNCGRSLETAAVKFPKTNSGKGILEKMLSNNILELLVTLVGFKMCGKNI